MVRFVVFSTFCLHYLVDFIIILSLPKEGLHLINSVFFGQIPNFRQTYFHHFSLSAVTAVTILALKTECSPIFKRGFHGWSVRCLPLVYTLTTECREKQRPWHPLFMEVRVTLFCEFESVVLLLVCCCKKMNANFRFYFSCTDNEYQLHMLFIYDIFEMTVSKRYIYSTILSVQLPESL